MGIVTPVMEAARSFLSILFFKVNNGQRAWAVAILTVLSASLPLLSAQRQHTENQQAEPTFGVLTLSDGSKFQTTLYGLKVIGKLKLRKSFLVHLFPASAAMAATRIRP